MISRGIGGSGAILILKILFIFLGSKYAQVFWVLNGKILTLNAKCSIQNASEELIFVFHGFLLEALLSLLWNRVAITIAIFDLDRIRSKKERNDFLLLFWN